MTDQNSTTVKFIIIDSMNEVKQIRFKLEQGLKVLVESRRTQIGNIEGSSQFRIMTYLYIDDELHIITPHSSSEGSHEENPRCPRYGNNTIDYIAIIEISLFDKVPKYYINYFDIFRFIVSNLMVTYHSTDYKRDLNGN
jgi:hypothetical protein